MANLSGRFVVCANNEEMRIAKDLAPQYQGVQKEGTTFEFPAGYLAGNFAHTLSRQVNEANYQALLARESQVRHFATA